MRDEERLDAVSGCRWVDEVVSDVPYIMNEEYLNYVIKKYRWVYSRLNTTTIIVRLFIFFISFVFTSYYDTTGLITLCTEMTLAW